MLTPKPSICFNQCPGKSYLIPINYNIKTTTTTKTQNCLTKMNSLMYILAYTHMEYFWRIPYKLVAVFVPGKETG